MAMDAIETFDRGSRNTQWGIYNCQSEEAGVICKTAVNTCQEGCWKCDNSPTCIPTPFIYDEVVDCPDHFDENPEHCDVPFKLRLVNGSNPYARKGRSASS
ncbi:uncharacterized protein [Temnothorax longispinosus]|uniref:uncharacterized protein n=1 Tax=Temnothorax longispinosus TaxID=300112 RepID=UPI003A9A326A